MRINFNYDGTDGLWIESSQPRVARVRINRVIQDRDDIEAVIANLRRAIDWLETEARYWGREGKEKAAEG